ncbi:MAG TPA: hypothetical protein VJV79_13085 [Polyangiaceae bacterium]|nr:hypothetical protein [Polyangiaceae bacterium]
MHSTLLCLTLILGASLSAFSCSERVNIGQNFPPDGQGGTAAMAGSTGSSGASATAGSDPWTCHITTCQGRAYLCGNCIDDDRDGLIDSADPECTGPCDDTEDSYYGGIPGQNNAPCHSDCYFDQDTGSGNDHCYWSSSCDPSSVAPDYPPSGVERCAYDPEAKVAGTSASCADLTRTQEPECESYCGPLTPNGCDSFGCCELPAGGGEFVWIGSTNGNQGSCNETTVGDPMACHPCTPVLSVFNPCEACEVCVGRTAPAASCTDASNRCPPGAQACGQAGEAACAPTQYCITGCCEDAPK